MIKVAQVGQHVFYGFGGRRGAIAGDMVARNSSASDIIAPAAKAPDNPTPSPTPTPTTVAVTTPAVAPALVASAS